MSSQDPVNILLAQARDALRASRTHLDLVDRLNAYLNEQWTPGEGRTGNCPDCGAPWWTVQVRCGCWPKPGTIEDENLRLRTALEFYAGKSAKIALADFSKTGLSTHERG